ncbi:alpha/beta hydrolase [Lentzea jiangxiensis]|uniref:Alpha/beta hydrolase family protein n=1 Tax=Lentzea jiangxiensis TaxID=641025 RepID=A0A1H0UMY8_9PSEU|nr:alpha/beta hydrolase [Lentzea jiangxiensis]SDP67617.1 hypothetical protein SAMN05421507_112134 [Lentzea jiangxiensis]
MTSATLRFTSATTLPDGVTERGFVHPGADGEVPGVLWTPAGTPTGLVLSAHGGGQHKRAPGIVDRALRCAAAGLAVIALDAPGHGDRARTADDERFAGEIRSRIADGHDVAAVVASYNALLAERAVPEWRAVLDPVPGLPGIGGEVPVGFWGVSMGSAAGIALVASEKRMRAAVFGLIGVTAGLASAAARVTVPVRFLLQWDDRLVARDAGLAMFDASPQRTRPCTPTRAATATCRPSSSTAPPPSWPDTARPRGPGAGPGLPVLGSGSRA